LRCAVAADMDILKTKVRGMKVTLSQNGGHRS
jgi:hypothetical protein